MYRRVTIPLSAVLFLLGTAAPSAIADGGGSPPGQTLYRDTEVKISYRKLNAGDPQQSKVPAAIREKTPEGSYLAQFQVENISQHEINDWSLTFELPDRITATDAVRLDSGQGDRATFQSTSANRVIEPGETSTLWYSARPDGSAHTPTWANFAKDGASPTKDTDGDGLTDDIEQRAKLDPKAKDTDGDGLTDFVELGNRSDALQRDTDGDGVSDGQEDPDGDSITNLRELQLKTAAGNADTDADGLADGKELARHTNPVKADTDGDGVEDGQEGRIGSDPRTAESAFDVKRTADGGVTEASAAVKDLRPDQVQAFDITELPADQKQFPKSTPGYLGNGYQLSADKTSGRAKVSFAIDPERTGRGVEPAVYRYDEKSQRLVKVAAQRLDGHTITATADDPAKYIVLDSRAFDKAIERSSRTDAADATQDSQDTQGARQSKDSDSDGISDHDERQIRDGKLLTGNGLPVGKLDPDNADSDGDSVVDGKEIQVVTGKLNGSANQMNQTSQADQVDQVYAKLTSNPLKRDTDGDGKRDDADKQPMVAVPTDMLIHQSANREGHRKEPDPNDVKVPLNPLVADDLTFNDYSYGELTDLSWQFYVASFTPESWMWGEFNSIMNVGKEGADYDHQQAVVDLYNGFRYGRGGQSAGTVTVDDNFDPARFQTVGSGTALSRAVASSPQEQQYIEKAEGIITRILQDNRGDTAPLTVADKLDQNLLYQEFNRTGLKYPVYDFSATNDNQRALSIAIHQFHGHTIELKDYTVSGNTFSGTLRFHSYDHFGLDPDDEITTYGFIDWFTLQHYDRFDGKYTPPIAQADVEVPISGSF
ncbi:DUF3289 family protein [Streptomyces sp. NPDC102360]|uniref:DUF3289 family protein n=1 Tax=Streptomyces sp. NPDC102360 TaxID=3366160 RepID=UPI0038049074